MKLEIPIIVGFDDMESLLDDLKKLQTYKCFEGAEEVLVDIEDVAKVLMDHVKAKKSVTINDTAGKIKVTNCNYNADASKKGDLISRADAIDAVNNIMPTKEGFYEPCEVLEELMRLPSAQPELPKWVQKAERMYDKALKMPYIKKPFAWALYQVWKEYDNE